MENPFRRDCVLRRVVSPVALCAFLLGGSPMAYAQGEFDFSDDAGSAGDGFDFADDFNFADETPAPPPKKKKTKQFTMPQNGKPVNLVFFEPVDNTPERTLDQLTEATVDQLKDEKYAQYDSVEAVPIKEKLDAMSADERASCLEDAACMAAMGREIGAENIIIGRIYTENRERPHITFDLVSVSEASNKNFIDFDTQKRLRKQEQDISGALIRLFGIETGSIDSLLTRQVVETSTPLPTGQLIAGIAVGVVAAAAIGVGAYFGSQAKSNDDNLKKAIDSNRDIVFEGYGDDTAAAREAYDSLKHQKDAKKYSDDASRDAMLANVLYATGAVAAVVSVILFLVKSDKDEDIFATHEDIYVSPSVAADGGGVVAGFSF